METKTRDEIKVMAEGGRKLATIRENLRKSIVKGENALKVEELAATLIEESGGKASFKMVPGYSWTTCINVNSGVVHGIPKKSVVFKKGDLVSVDIGYYYNNFHTDTSFSIGIEPDTEMKKFIKIGKETLLKAIKKAKAGNRVYDISKAIEDNLGRSSLFPIKALVGHGIGRKLHEDPHIPCFVKSERENTAVIKKGAVFAIEVMYTKGKPAIKVSSDGWTIQTRDDKISGLFEETVAVTNGGPIVLTKK